MAAAKLCSALRLMLRQLDLTYTVENEVLLITSPAVEQELLQTRLYTIGDWGIPVPADDSANRRTSRRSNAPAQSQPPR